MISDYLICLERILASNSMITFSIDQVEEECQQYCKFYF